MKVTLVKEKIRSGEKNHLILMDTFNFLYTYEVTDAVYRRTSVNQKFVAEEDLNFLRYIGDNKMMRMY